MGRRGCRRRMGGCVGFSIVDRGTENGENTDWVECEMVWLKVCFWMVFPEQSQVLDQESSLLIHTSVPNALHSVLYQKHHDK
jgi:hypothetical protein